MIQRQDAKCMLRSKGAYAFGLALAAPFMTRYFE